MPRMPASLPSHAPVLCVLCAPRAERLARAAVLGSLLALGCGSQDLIPPPIQNDAELYWQLDLNYHAVALSTTAYDTLRLVATPRNFRGEALSDLPAAQYVSADPDKVAVTPDGTVIAVRPTSTPVEVVATLTAHNIKHVDTARVSVVSDPAPPVLATFSIHPVPPDSAKVAMYYGALVTGLFVDTLFAQATSTAGDRIPTLPYDAGGFLPVWFRSSDTSIATIDQAGIVKGVKPGSVTIYATTSAFGVPKADTLSYRVGWPLLAVSPAYSNTPNLYFPVLNEYRFAYPEIWIGTGGVVTWLASGFYIFPDSTVGDTIDVTFAGADAPNVAPARLFADLVAKGDPYAATWFWLACGYDCDNGGNAALTSAAPLVARSFPVPGVYEYRSAKHDMVGRIVVVDER